MADEERGERRALQVRRWNTDPNEALGDLTLSDFQRVAVGSAGDTSVADSFPRDRAEPFAAAQPDGGLAIGIPLPRGHKVDPSLVASAPAFMVRGFTSVVGACLSIASAHQIDRWVHIDTDTPEFAALADGRFSIHLLDRKRIIASQDVHFARDEGTRTRFESLHKTVKEWHVELPERDTFRLVIGTDRFFGERVRTPVQRLSEGWARHRTNVLEHLCDECENVRERGFPTTAPPERLRGFVDVARKGNAGAIVAFLEELFERDSRALYALFSALGEYQDYTDERLEGGGHEALIHACDAFFSAPGRTRCGRQLPWLDPTDASIRTLALAPDKMPEPEKVDDFWGSLWGYTPFRYAGRVLQGHDQPLDDSPENEHLDLDRFPRAEDPEEALGTARSLFQIALSNKQWTIPPGAVLDLRFGPFSHVQAWEFPDSCVFVCRTPNGRFSVVEALPREAEVTFSFPLYVGGDDDELRDDRVRSALHLLFAALVHDFFVLEKRERVFETRTQRRPPAGCIAPADGPVVVYLPRRRYLRKPDLARTTQQLSLAARRPHMVAGHLRRAAVSSEHQRALALRHGFSIPAGYTFVRPHERGAGERDVIYRSRSATWLLYDDQEPTREYEGSDWFRFERDVRALMQRLGFSVEHVSSGKRGDNGVDLYATKGRGLDELSWIVQCKCFSPARKVSIGIVRELVGALSQYPRGTRGMLVTTSSFTSDALELAEREHIEVVDGRRFAELRGSTSS